MDITLAIPVLSNATVGIFAGIDSLTIYQSGGIGVTLLDVFLAIAYAVTLIRFYNEMMAIKS